MFVSHDIIPLCKGPFHQPVTLSKILCFFSEEDKHMVEYKHFNLGRAVQCSVEYYILCTRWINNTLSCLELNGLIILYLPF